MFSEVRNGNARESLSLTSNVLKFSFSFLINWVRSPVAKRRSQHFQHASHLCQFVEFFLRLGYAELYHNLGDDTFLDMAPEITIKRVRMNDFRFSYWVRIFLFVFTSRSRRSINAYSVASLQSFSLQEWRRLEVKESDNWGELREEKVCENHPKV
jgi:hypothetical protein